MIGQPEAPSTIGRMSLHGLLQSLGPQGRGRDESVERGAGQQKTDARRAGGAPLVPAAVREQEGHLATELRAEGRRIGPQQVRIRPHGQAQRRRRSLPHDRPPEGRSVQPFSPVPDEGGQPVQLGLEHPRAEVAQAVEAAARLLTPRIAARPYFLDEASGKKPLQGRVERPRPQPPPPLRALGHRPHDRVPVGLAVRQRDEDLELGVRQGQERPGSAWAIHCRCID